MAIRRRGGSRWVLAVLACAVALFFLFPQTRDRPLSLIEVPFVWTASQVTRLTSGVGLSLRLFRENHMALSGVREDNRALTREVDRLTRELSEARELAAEVPRLREIVQFRDTNFSDGITARVIGTDATSWFQSFLINRGSFDGLVAGDAVLAPQGVVGQLAKVTHNTAQVLSVHHRMSVVPARVQRSRHAGILVGGVRASVLAALTEEEREQLPALTYLTEMKYMYRAADVRVGDTIVTSGLANRFPPGIPIGTVVRVDRAKNETFLKVYVAPVVSFDTVEEVVVPKTGKDQAQAPEQQGAAPPEGEASG